MESRDPFGILGRADFYAPPGAILICVLSMVLRRLAKGKNSLQVKFSG